MTFEAKGMLCYILSLPDDWILHTTKLMSDFKIGRHYLKRCFDEIEKCGYMAKVGVVKGKGGRFEGYSYMFYDTPIATPRVDLPHADFPHTEEQHLQRTNIDQELINTNNPLNPLKGENEIDLFGLDFNSWIEAYIRIHRRFGVDKKKVDINEHWFKRQLLKLNEQGIDNQLPLTALTNILQDSWEREHRFPSALPKKMFNMDNVQRWAVMIHNVRQ